MWGYETRMPPVPAKLLNADAADCQPAPQGSEWFQQGQQLIILLSCLRKKKVETHGNNLSIDVSALHWNSRDPHIESFIL